MAKPIKPIFKNINYTKRSYRKDIKADKHSWRYFEKTYCFIKLKDGTKKRGFIFKVLPASIQLGIIEDVTTLEVVSQERLEKLNIVYVYQDVEATKHRIYQQHMLAYRRRLKQQNRKKQRKQSDAKTNTRQSKGET